MAYDAFSFFFPTNIRFGAGESAHTVEYLLQYVGRKKVFLVTYADFRLPVMDALEAALQAAGIEYLLYPKAVPNPRAEQADEAAAALTAFGAECVLGVGGGSVIDTAKAAALLAANPTAGGIWDYVSYEKSPEKPALPLGLVVSIASTGSESNESFVLTGRDGKQKLIFSERSLRPLFSVCDPELSFSLPARQTALGAADILSHILEQYMHAQEGVEASDNMSMGLMKAVVKYAPIAMKEPANLAARSNLMWCSILAMSLLLGVGHQENWVCHMLEHAVSARYDLPHAAGMTAIMPAYYAYMADQDRTGKLSALGAELFGADATPEGGIEGLVRFFRQLGLPVTLKEALGCSADEETLTDLAENAIPWGSMEAGGYTPFTVADARNVFERSFQ